MNRSFINRCAAIAIVALPLLLIGGSSAQRNTDKDPPMREILNLPGKVLSETKSARASGNLNLTGYRVEEVRLQRNLTVEVRGQQVAVDRAWRITVNGGPFPVRALPAVIWIDDQIAGNGIENETLTQITAITFDGSLIREGAVVSLSYGEDKATRVRLSPRLQIKREGGNQ